MSKKFHFLQMIFITIFFFLCITGKVYAKNIQNDSMENKINIFYYDFFEHANLKELDEELKAISKDNSESISFSEIYQYLLKGEVERALSICIDQFIFNFIDEISKNKILIVKLSILVIIAGIFNNYSSIYKFSYIGEQGFYITYLMIAVLLMQSFTLSYEIAVNTISYIKELMQCLLPAFYMSITLCSGLTTSHMVNSMFIWMLSFLEKILCNVILPLIRIYFLIVLLNQINIKDRFSKLSNLLKQAILFILKGIITGIISLNLMKGLLVPVYESAKYSMFQKGLSVIPGGTTVSGLSTILLGAGVLIKNSIGITSVIILFVLTSIPILKLCCFYVVYRIILAFVQPISEQRILTGIQGTADSIGILIRATTTSLILSILSIAIVMMTTNMKLYTG